MNKLAERSHSILASHGAAPLFLDIVRANAEPPDFLDGIFHPPSEYFSEDEASEYTGGCLIPIFDDGGPAIATLHDPDSKQFVEICMESCETGITYKNWQQVLCSIVNQLFEYHDSAPGNDVVDQTGFLHVKELLNFRIEHQKDVAWDERFGEFVASL